MEDSKQTTDAGNTQDQAKTQFTPEQQALVDSIVKNAMGRAGKEAKELAEAASKRAADLEKQLEDLTTQLSSKSSSNSSKDLSDVDSLKAQIEEMQNANKTLQQQFEAVRRQKEDTEKTLDKTKNEKLEVQKRQFIKEAIAEHGFIDSDEVLALTDRYFKFDGNTVEVVTEQGTPRLNTMYNPMSLKDFFVEYAAKKPHLVKSTHRSGTGASASGISSEMTGSFSPEKIFGKKSDAKSAQALKVKNPAEYARLKEIARSQGLI